MEIINSKTQASPNMTDLSPPSFVNPELSAYLVFLLSSLYRLLPLVNTSIRRAFPPVWTRSGWGSSTSTWLSSPRSSLFTTSYLRRWSAQWEYPWNQYSLLLIFTLRNTLFRFRKHKSAILIMLNDKQFNVFKHAELCKRSVSGKSQNKHQHAKYLIQETKPWHRLVSR